MKTVKLVRNYPINLKNIGLYLSRGTETSTKGSCERHSKDLGTDQKSAVERKRLRMIVTHGYGT